MNESNVIKGNLESALEGALKEHDGTLSDRWYREDWLAHLTNQNEAIATTDEEPRIIYLLEELAKGKSGILSLGHITINVDAEASWPLLFLRRGSVGPFLVEYQLDTEKPVINAEEHADQIIRDRTYSREYFEIYRLQHEEIGKPLFSQNEAVYPQGRQSICIVELTAQGIVTVDYDEEDLTNYKTSPALSDLFERVQDSKVNPQEFVSEIFTNLHN